MNKSVYEDALADVKKLTEVAESNATNAVLSAVVPRIRSLIDRELMNEDAMSDEDMLLDDPVASSHVDDSPADAITPPDEEGKVTLDLDAMTVDDEHELATPISMFTDDEEYELSLESAGTLKIKNLYELKEEKDVVHGMQHVKGFLANLSGASKFIKESKALDLKISQMISFVDDMYGFVQESISDSKRKNSYNESLEKLYQKLMKVQETSMSKNNRRNRLHEEDETQVDLDADVGGEEVADDDGELTLKLTGLPDDVDLDDVGVDLVAGATDEDEEVELDMSDDDDDGGDDLGDLELSDDEGDDMQTQLESVLNLPDNTVVEINENMLKREIKRMKALRENVNGPSDEMDANGHCADDAASLDDFGGATSNGEPLDVDVETDYTAEPLGEMDEMDDYDDVTAESVRRRLVFESRFQRRIRAKGRQLKNEAQRARGRKRAQLVSRYNHCVKRFNESVKRTKTLKRKLNESSNRSRLNSASRTRNGEVKLRRKLAEANLNNVKLHYANKVLQHPALTRKQKGQVMKQLEECRNAREAKLTYENVSRVVSSSRTRTDLNENRRRSGSGSRVVRPSATPINEGFEINRWTRLAGIK